MDFDSTVGGELATSFAPLEYLDTWLATYPAWADKDETAKQLLAMQATMELTVKYRGKWIGQKATTEQRLPWPRARRIDTNETLKDSDGMTLPLDRMPEPLMEAQVAVIKILDGGGSFTLQPSTRDQFVKSKKIDVLATEWFEGAPTQTRYPAIDQILYGLASGAESGVATIEMRLGLTEQEANQNSGYSPMDDGRYFNRG